MVREISNSDNEHKKSVLKSPTVLWGLAAAGAATLLVLGIVGKNADKCEDYCGHDHGHSHGAKSAQTATYAMDRVVQDPRGEYHPTGPNGEMQLHGPGTRVQIHGGQTNDRGENCSAGGHHHKKEGVYSSIMKNQWPGKGACK